MRFRACAAIWALAVTGCIDTNLTLCADGRACASTQLCDEAHHLCVNPDQLSACAGSADGTPCPAASGGACFDQVCLTPGCGNGVVEPGERCDDANHVGGDGCSSDCSSDERCGNGVVDPGEQCDDGNLISHDGCDSRCQPETAVWKAYPMQLPSALGHQVVFDPVHGRAVFRTQSTTWQWDGQAWQVSITPSSASWNSVVYDSDRHVVVAFGRSPVPPNDPVVGEWDGTTWTVKTPPGTPSSSDVVVYDHARHKILALEGTGATYYDPATATWETTTTLPFTTYYDTDAAYDEQRGRVVVLAPPDPSLKPAPATVTWEWDGNTWTMTASAPAAFAGWAMTYDGTRGGVVAVGGFLRPAPAYSGAVYLWNGSAWTDTGAAVPAAGNAAVWFDASRGSLFGGGGLSSAAGTDVWELAGTTLSDHSTLYLGGTPTLIYDATRDRVLALDEQGAAWSWDGSWHLAGKGALSPQVFAFDPVRAGVVTFDTNTGSTWIFRGAWAQLIAAAPTLPINSMVYDYANRRMIGLAGLDTFALAAGDTSWASLGVQSGSVLGSAAYDLGNQCPAALGGSTDQTLEELIGGQWTSTLSPGLGYRAIGWFARRSVALYPASPPTGQALRPIWELKGSAWAPFGQLPFGFDSPGATERSRGRLLFVAQEGATTLVELQLASGLADETCVPGDDADGDGLAGCADPDCWWSCDLRCPYATTCP